jgi:hypothetical protein
VKNLVLFQLLCIFIDTEKMRGDHPVLLTTTCETFCVAISGPCKDLDRLPNLVLPYHEIDFRAFWNSTRHISGFNWIGEDCLFFAPGTYSPDQTD